LIRRAANVEGNRLRRVHKERESARRIAAVSYGIAGFHRPGVRRSFVERFETRQRVFAWGWRDVVLLRNTIHVEDVLRNTDIVGRVLPIETAPRRTPATVRRSHQVERVWWRRVLGVHPNGGADGKDCAQQQRTQAEAGKARQASQPSAPPEYAALGRVPRIRSSMRIRPAVYSPIAAVAYSAQNSAHGLDPTQWVTFPARHCRAPLRANVRTACELTNSLHFSLACFFGVKQNLRLRYGKGRADERPAPRTPEHAGARMMVARSAGR
jgi:hypothetical protein